MTYEATLALMAQDPIRVSLYGGRIQDRAEATFAPEAYRELADRWSDLARGDEEGAIPPDPLRRFGTDLADLLLPDALREALLRERSRCIGQKASLRLRIQIETPLEPLPLEAMHLGGDIGFLGLDAVVRPYLALAGTVPSVEPESRLRIMVAYADPATPKHPALGWIGSELRAIRAEMDGRHDVRVVNDAVPSVLERAILEFRPHVFHFSGHGETRATGGSLVLQGAEKGRTLPLRGDELGRWLAAAGTRLAFLSACDTGAVARDLGERGIPSVIAMQTAIRSSAPPGLSAAFYRALATGAPADDALAEARQAMRDRDADWLAPALFAAKPERLVPDAVAAAPRIHRERPLVGRTVELGEIRRALVEEGVRAVALTGTGGVGKSRLAREAQENLRDRYPDGSHYVPCGDAADGQALAALIHARLRPGEASVPSGFAYLAGQRMLLVLDGVDTLLHAGGPEPLAELLASADRAAIVTTSRLRPSLDGVLEIPLRPMEECETLFLQTARAVQPYFVPTSEESKEISRICLRVGGLPLAIVLAATRLRDMTVADLAEMVQEGSLGIAETIASSVGRLAPEDARVLRNLAVFRGSFAAIDAAGVTELSRFAAMDALGRLRDHSLVEADLSGAQARYSLLDPIREYLEESRPEDDEEGQRARYFHAKHVTERARKVRELMEGRKWAEASDLLWNYLGDFRAALDFADANGLFELSGNVVDSLIRTFFESGLLKESAHLIALGRRSAEARGDRTLESRLLGFEGVLAALRSDYPASRGFHRARADLCAELGDAVGRADALFDLATCDFWNSDPAQVMPLLVDAESAAQATDKPEMVAAVYMVRAMLAMRTQEPEGAREWAERALAQPRTEGAVQQLMVDVYAARALSYASERGRAETVCRQALADARHLESRLHLAAGLHEMAKILEASGRQGLAARCLLAAAGHWRSIGSTRLGQVQADIDRLRQLHPDALLAAEASDTTLFGVSDEILSGVC